jgi:hypothetical protein
MEEEYDAFITNNTWDLVPRPVGSNIATGKWIFKYKFNSDGTLERYKANWVLRGFTHRATVNYDKTFSPVVKLATVRMLLLHSTLSETIYYSQPMGFVDPT